MTMNYDPNICEGQNAKQTVRLVFGKWEYRKTMEVEAGGSGGGLYAINGAIDAVFDKLEAACPDNIRLTLEDENGDELICEMRENCFDEFEEGAWLKSMVVSAEIIGLKRR